MKINIIYSNRKSHFNQHWHKAK